jgi:hypothetical protein
LQQQLRFLCAYFFGVSSSTLKLVGYALLISKRHAAFIPHAKHDSTIISEAITLTETKAEQLDGIVSATQRILLLAMTTNDYWSKPLQTLYTRSKPMDHFYYFYIVAMIIKPKEIVNRT